jgi:hypothetical protein
VLYWVAWAEKELASWLIEQIGAENEGQVQKGPKRGFRNGQWLCVREKRPPARWKTKGIGKEKENIDDGVVVVARLSPVLTVVRSGGSHCTNQGLGTLPWLSC